MDYLQFTQAMAAQSQIQNIGQVMALSEDQEPTAAQNEVFHLVLDLRFYERRETALLELSKRRETLQDLAPLLWHSFGTIASLIQEIIFIYPDLQSSASLTSDASNRVCNSLALLQCVASHDETRPLFLKAQIPMLLYPFLEITHKERPFEYLQLTSLGVIGALVKHDDSEVIEYFIEVEIDEKCVPIMTNGSPLSKTVATYIIQKLLADDRGLKYICATQEKFDKVNAALAEMVHSLFAEPSQRLFKHVIRCYARLTENPRAKEALRDSLPRCLKADPNTLLVPEPIQSFIRQDSATSRWLSTTLKALYGK